MRKSQTPVEELEGRELDTVIAREVFGWEDVRPAFKSGDAIGRKMDEGVGQFQWFKVPHYSSDIRAAWEVRDEMVRRGYWWKMTGGCHTQTARLWKNDVPFEPDWLAAKGVADLMPTAICRAALKAVRSDE